MKDRDREDDRERGGDHADRGDREREREPEREYERENGTNGEERKGIPGETISNTHNAFADHSLETTEEAAPPAVHDDLDTAE